jgi:uncharacterized protein (TIGR01777 family)
MRVVVTGGTGLLGSALVARLRAEVHEVTVLTRLPRRPGHVQWDAESPTGNWTSALEGAHAVVHLAGESLAGRWTRRKKARIRDSRVLSTRALVTAIKAARQPPAVLISGSAMGYYGPHGDEPLTEESPAGSDFLASVCVEWEREALAAAPATRVVLVRSGLALDRSGGALPPMTAPFYVFMGGPLGSGRQYMSWIHRDDWVQMVHWALTSDQVSGPINATAPNPVTNREFMKTLGRVVHRPAVVAVPSFALRLALGGEMAQSMLLNGQRVLPAVAESHGFKFKYAQLEPAFRALFR